MKPFYVTIKGSWMEACGLGNQDTQAEVLEVMRGSGREGDFFECMYSVLLPSGKCWTVAKGRTRGGLQ